LTDNPFGREPFDALYPTGFGTYQDNYNGYIFLGPLDKEPNGELLLDLYNDEFIKEMDRRLHLVGSSLKDYWRLKELNENEVIGKLLANHAKTRWERNDSQ
jgi:hypothetical protein